MLPKIDYPTFELTIPSTKQKIRYRPFLVREEKILLMAQQSENINDIMAAVKQLINNCIVTPGVNIEKLMVFDIEYIFLKLRASSVNNIITIYYKDAEDNKQYDVEINLDEVEVIFNEDHTNKIKLNDNTTLVLSYPGIELPSNVLNAPNEGTAFFEIVKSCFDKIYVGEEIYEFKDAGEKEKNEFLDNLSVNAFEEIKKFFETMPKLKHTVEYTNSLGHKRTKVFETLSDFFTLL